MLPVIQLEVEIHHRLRYGSELKRSDSNSTAEGISDLYGEDALAGIRLGEHHGSFVLIPEVPDKFLLDRFAPCSFHLLVRIADKEEFMWRYLLNDFLLQGVLSLDILSHNYFLL